ncbi:hypothetical protein vseg_003574 [Gypsophila vaccaria]
MSSKDRFEKTFSRKKNETAATAKPKPNSQPPHTKSSVSKPIKITFKCKEPTENKAPSSSPVPQKKKKKKKKPEKDETVNKEEKKKKRKAEDDNVGEETAGSKKMKVKIGKKEENADGEDAVLECVFPTARISRIVKSDGFDSKITAEAVFLINKATVKFIELFSEDAYGYAVEERKNFVGYKHLSSVVSKGKMFDFLSDFVPEKVTAEKALAERNPSETLPG